MKTRPMMRDVTTALIAIVSATILAACSPEPADLGLVESAGASRASAEPNLARTDEDLARGGADLVDHAIDQVKDAAITAAIHAELAIAGKLGEINIDVDTIDGRVVLRGTAPDARAREEATRLAVSVEGVRSVDNRLAVSGES